MSFTYNTSNQNAGYHLASTHQLIEIFITESENLAIMLEKEAEYFKSQKIKESEKFTERKLQLIEELQGIKSTIVNDKELLKRLPADLKARIVSSDEKLKKASEENYKQATIAKEVNRILMEAVYDAVAKSKGASKNYGKSGVYDNTMEAGTPIAISQSV